MLVQDLIAPLHPTARMHFVNLVVLSPTHSRTSLPKSSSPQRSATNHPFYIHIAKNPPDPAGQLCLLLTLLRAWWTQKLNPLWTASVIAACRKLVDALHRHGSKIWKLHLAEAVNSRLVKISRETPGKNPGGSCISRILCELDQIYFKLYYYEG